MSQLIDNRPPLHSSLLDVTPAHAWFCSNSLLTNTATVFLCLSLSSFHFPSLCVCLISLLHVSPPVKTRRVIKQMVRSSHSSTGSAHLSFLSRVFFLPLFLVFFCFSPFLHCILGCLPQLTRSVTTAPPADCHLHITLTYHLTHVSFIIIAQSSSECSGVMLIMEQMKNVMFS